MDSWTLVTSMVCGVYFTFFVFAAWICLLTRNTFACYQMGISGLNLAYGLMTLYTVATPFSEAKLMYAMPIAITMGSFTVFLYFSAITSLMGWNNWFIKWLKGGVLFTTISSLTLYYLPVFTGDIGTMYTWKETPPLNRHVLALFGQWQMKPAFNAVLAVGGVSTMVGNLYFLFRFFKNKTHEYLLILGAISTIVFVINDILLGAGVWQYLAPLSIMGFLCEVFRFHKYIYSDLYSKNINLTKEMIQMAQFSESGRVAQQMCHDLKSHIRDLFRLIPDNHKKNGAKEIFDAALNISDLYGNKIRKDNIETSSSQLKSLKSQLEFVQQVFSHKLEKENIALSIDCPDDIYVNLSTAECLVVFGNLIKNSVYALKDRSSKKSITIRGRKEEAVIFVWIIDNGSGIEKEIAHEIFNSHFTTSEEGLGFGLNIVRETLLSRQALIRWVPEADNTTFEIQFV